MQSEPQTVTRSEFEALKVELAELKLSRAQKAIRLFKRNKRLSLVLLAGLFFIPLSLYALSITKSFTFTAGSPTVASEVNANFDQLFTKVNDLAAFHPPIGAILAWHKSEGNTPGLPATGEWVECNGQTLNDFASPYNTRTIPNLNNPPTAGYFLRGATTSGVFQGDAFQGHWHQGGYYAAILNLDSAGLYGPQPPGTHDTADYNIKGAITDNINGTPRTANETRPVNMSVVWIMKVK